MLIVGMLQGVRIANNCDDSLEHIQGHALEIVGKCSGFSKYRVSGDRDDGNNLSAVIALGISECIRVAVIHGGLEVVQEVIRAAQATSFTNMNEQHVIVENHGFWVIWAAAKAGQYKRPPR